MASHGVNTSSSSTPPPPSASAGPRRAGSTISFDEQQLARSQSHPTTRSPRLFAQRHSTNERINHILEIARERAETMGATKSTTSHPGTQTQWGGRRIAETDRITDDHYSSADEHTGIMSRAPERQYQSITTSPPSALPAQAAAASGGGGARARARNPSTASSSRGGRPLEDAFASQRVELPPPATAHDTDDEMDGGPTERRSRKEKKRKSRSGGGGEPWHQSIVTHFASIELENKGSVARDHLALERTFLAWLRTSLAFASIGIAITQLFRLNTSLGGHADHDPTGTTLRRLGQPLGATFLGISIVILFLGYHRYFHAQRWIIAGKFPASRGTIIGVAFIAFAVMIASLVVVIVVHPGDREL